MTAPDPRLGEIEARLAAVTPGPIELTMYPDEGGRLSSEKRKLIVDIYGGGNTAFYAGARDDVAYLLAELRDRDEKLAIVEGAITALHEEMDGGDLENYCSHDGDEYPCETVTAIRAAVAAANGGGE